MPPGSDYHLFKQGIEPKWEDSANAKGGKWVFNFKRGQRETISDHWLHTVGAVNLHKLICRCWLSLGPTLKTQRK